MSNNCSCSNIPFTPECSYCYENLCRKINERDAEIVKIREKNINQNKCKCAYFMKTCLYFCNSCNRDLYNWKNNKIHS